MVVFTHVASVDRIIYAIFSRFNQDGQSHTLAARIWTGYFQSDP